MSYDNSISHRLISNVDLIQSSFLFIEKKTRLFQTLRSVLFICSVENPDGGGRSRGRPNGKRKFNVFRLIRGITRVVVITKHGPYSALCSAKYAEPELCVINPGVIFTSKCFELGYEWKVNRPRGIMMRNIFSHTHRHDAREFILLFCRLCLHAKIARARRSSQFTFFIKSANSARRASVMPRVRFLKAKRARERILFLSPASAFRSASVSQSNANGKTTRHCA